MVCFARANRFPLPLSGFLTLFLIFTVSCSDDDSGSQPTSCPECESYDNAMALQDSCFALLSSLLAVMDTTAARDSVLTAFRSDPRVKTAAPTAQGICVDYQDGIRGGLVIDYLDGASNWEYSKRAPFAPPVSSSSAGRRIPDAYDVPTSTRTALIYPVNSERPEWTNLGQRILAEYASLFPRAGFQNPVFKPDASADLACFGSLDTYGVVHIITHGWQWPSGEVYMLTGQRSSPETAKSMWSDIQDHHIVIVTDKTGRTYYFVDEIWFARENGFSTHSTLVFAEFCFSFLGGWPAALERNVGRGAYLGFDEKVEIYWGADCARHLFMEMTAKSSVEPVTVGRWFSSPGLPLELFGARLKHEGNDNLALWEPVITCEGFPPPLGNRLTYRVVGTSVTFTSVTEAVAERVGGHVVYRVRRTEDPPGLGQYMACDPLCGEVEVATDWWDISDPGNNGRFFYEPPLVNLCEGDVAVGTVREWVGEFAGSPATSVTEIVAYEAVTVPYRTFSNAMKVLITGTGALEDVPLYFWFADGIPGPVKAQEVESGDAIELIGYQGPGSVIREASGAPIVPNHGWSVGRLLGGKLR